MEENIKKIIENKEVIIKHYNETTNIEELKNTLKNIDNSKANSHEIQEIKNCIINRLNKLNNKNIKNVLDEAKTTNINISNFSIIETKEEINDKDIYGFRNDIYYLKLSKNNTNRIFELDPAYIIDIENILSNKDLLQNLTEKEILEKIKPYVKELDKVEMNYKTNLDKDTIIKEINNIYDNEIRTAFTKNIKEVLNERIKLNEYIKNNDLQNELLNYSLNSKGERIYYIKDKIIKFVGSEKKMYFLSENGNEITNEQKNKEEEFEKQEDSNNDINHNNIVDSIDNIELFNTEYYINLLNYIIYKMGNKETLSIEEGKIINRFFILCLTTKQDIPSELFKIYDDFSNYLKEYNNFSDYEQYLDKEIIDKLKIETEIKINKEKKDTKELVLENKNLGFVDITLIICSMIIAIIIILYII